MGAFDFVNPGLSFAGSTIGEGLGGLTGGIAKGAAQTGYQASAPEMADAERKRRFAEALQSAQGRTAPGAEFRTGQQTNISDLQAQANGQGPSVATHMLDTARENNLAQSMALASSARGQFNPGAVMRQQQQGLATSNQDAFNQAGQMRIQEQLNARAQLAQALQSARGQDLQLTGMNDDLVAKYEAMGLSADQARLQAQMQAQQINAGIALGNTQGQNQFVGGVLSGVGSAGAMMATKSDERAKKNVKDGGKDIRGFLDALKAHRYKYKEPERDGKGEHFSVMAQELEKTPVGKAMVEETPHGKVVNYGRGFGAILAAQAHLNERLKQIEARKGGR